MKATRSETQISIPERQDHHIIKGLTARLDGHVASVFIAYSGDIGEADPVKLSIWLLAL